jgi:hypothetical protein
VPAASVAAVVETAGGDTKMIMTAELILVPRSSSAFWAARDTVSSAP